MLGPKSSPFWTWQGPRGGIVPWLHHHGGMYLQTQRLTPSFRWEASSTPKLLWMVRRCLEFGVLRNICNYKEINAFVETCAGTNTSGVAMPNLALKRMRGGHY